MMWVLWSLFDHFCADGITIGPAFCGRGSILGDEGWHLSLSASGGAGFCCRLAGRLVWWIIWGRGISMRCRVSHGWEMTYLVRAVGIHRMNG